MFKLTLRNMVRSSALCAIALVAATSSGAAHVGSGWVASEVVSSSTAASWTPREQRTLNASGTLGPTARIFFPVARSPYFPPSR